MAARNGLMVAAGVMALAAAVASCSSSNDPSSIGPLGGPEASGNVCLSQQHAKVITDGWPSVQNTSKTPVVIDRVSLANPKGMSLITAWAVPRMTDGYGAEPGYPPGKNLHDGVDWAQRQPAAGAVIPHQVAPHKTDLLFVVRIRAATATATGVNIWYHVGSEHWHIQTVFGLAVLAGGSSGCPRGS